MGVGIQNIYKNGVYFQRDTGSLNKKPIKMFTYVGVEGTGVG